MKLSRKLLIGLLVSAWAMFSVVRAQEKKVNRGALPPAVEKTVAEQSKGATIRGFSTEVEKEQRFYEVELTANGHRKDISMDEQGNIVEVEDEIAMDSLPQSVKDGLTKAAGTGTISEVESLTKGGKVVAYEAVVKTGTKRSELQVGPDGKKLAHPE